MTLKNHKERPVRDTKRTKVDPATLTDEQFLDVVQADLDYLKEVFRDALRAVLVAAVVNDRILSRMDETTAREQ